MFRSILFLNGSLPDLSELNLSENATLIAADGAYGKLISNGFCPHYVIGDGDSLAQKEIAATTTLIIDRDQETTDFEKCLHHIAQHDLGPTLVCGISGGDLDHQHNNLNTFMKHAHAYQMCFLHTHSGSPWQWGFPVQRQWRATLAKDAIVSILPFDTARLTTSGLFWPLNDEVLSAMGRSGARNRSAAEQVQIDVSEGQALIVVDAASIVQCTWDDVTMLFHALTRLARSVV